MKIYKYNEFITEEESKIKNLITSMLVSLGLTYANAQDSVKYIDSIEKANIIEILADYNNSPYSIYDLKKNLKLNNISDPDLFINYYLDKDDDTILLKSEKIPSIGLYINPNDDWLDHAHVGLSVNLPLNKRKRKK